MATQISRIMPASPAQMALLAHLHSFPRDKLERTIEALIAIVDLIDGDSEAEDSETMSSTVNERGRELLPYEDLQPQDDEDRERTGDHQDIAWCEWDGRNPRHNRIAQHEPTISLKDEDDEEHGLEDGFVKLRGNGPGCEIADPGGCEHDGREDGHDDEREQMLDDVPCIQVVTLEPNIFNGQRQRLGYTLPRPGRDGTVEPEL